MTLILSQEVKDIIKDLADIQIKSFQSIISGEFKPDEECLFIMDQFNNTWEDIQAEAKVKLNHFKDLKNEPLILGVTEDIDLSILRHLLFHLEEEYQNKVAVYELWDTFFYIERCRQPILLTIKKKKK